MQVCSNAFRKLGCIADKMMMTMKCSVFVTYLPCQLQTRRVTTPSDVMYDDFVW